MYSGSLFSGLFLIEVALLQTFPSILYYKTNVAILNLDHLDHSAFMSLELYLSLLIFPKDTVLATEACQ